MARVVSLDKVFHFTDPKLISLDHLLTRKTPKKANLPSKCQLLTTASTFIRESRRKVHTQVSKYHQSDQVRSTSSTTSKLRQRRKKKLHQISEVLSMDYQNTEAGVTLCENYSEQPGVVLKYLLQRDANSGHVSPYEKEILKGWIMCLHREDRMQIEKERTWFPNPRNIQLRHIDSGLNQIYGVGTKRRLRPGQEASLIQSIQKFLIECYKYPNQIALRESTIHDTILSWADLQDLIKYPFCMKQVQCHFKIMATRWRYSGKINFLDKAMQKAINIAHSRGHFLDLTKTNNPLVKYLLKYSNYKEPVREQPRRRHTMIEHSRHHIADHDGLRF